MKKAIHQNSLKRKRNTIFIFFIVYSTILFFLGSCKNETKTKPIARAYDSYLYPEDLRQIINKGTTKNDSLNLVNAYIDQWQRQQVLLQNAQGNATIDIEQINKQIQDYKNSLIIYEFEKSIINEKLDTLVSEKEIADYYKEHEQIFILKRPIFKVSFIALKEDTPELNRVKKWFRSNDLRDHDLLMQYCQTYSTNFSLNDTSWYYLEELSKKIPIGQIDENNYRNYGQIFNISENNKIYLIILHDSKFKDNQSPLDIERNNIRNLIVNQRKILLINKEEQNLINKARSKNKIEVYNQ